MLNAFFYKCIESMISPVYTFFSFRFATVACSCFGFFFSSQCIQREFFTTMSLTSFESYIQSINIQINTKKKKTKYRISQLIYSTICHHFCPSLFLFNLLFVMLKSFWQRSIFFLNFRLNFPKKHFFRIYLIVNLCKQVKKEVQYCFPIFFCVNDEFKVQLLLLHVCTLSQCVAYLQDLLCQIDIRNRDSVCFLSIIVY